MSGATLKLYGVTIPAERYTRLEKLASIAFEYFDVRTDDRRARRESVRIAQELDAWVAARVASAEKGMKRP